MWHRVAKSVDGEGEQHFVKCWEGTVNPPVHRCYICDLERALKAVIVSAPSSRDLIVKIIGEKAVVALEREADEEDAS